MATAAIAAGGSILGSAIQGKSAKKVAKIQAQTAQQQIAAQQQALANITALNQPAITRGNEAGSLYGGFLGTGDAAASARALQTFRDSTGYQDLLNQGLGAVNASAYARGMGDSGSALKALQTRGTQIANSSAQQWLGNLGTLINAGTQAAGNVSGVTQNTTNAITGIATNAANQQSNAALAQGASWGNTLQNIGNLAAYAYGSSYGNNANAFGQQVRTGANAALNAIGGRYG